MRVVDSYVCGANCRMARTISKGERRAEVVTHTYIWSIPYYSGLDLFRYIPLSIKTQRLRVRHADQEEDTYTICPAAVVSTVKHKFVSSRQSVIGRPIFMGIGCATFNRNTA